MAKDCHYTGEYVIQSATPLPVKWMAIESIKNYVFTIESDIWSFGVTLWELFSLGDNPYPGVNVDETFIDRILEGLRLNQPKYCPDEIFHAIMMPCWNIEPNNRPNFGFISQSLSKFILDDMNLGYIDLCNQFEDTVQLTKQDKVYFLNSDNAYLQMSI